MTHRPPSDSFANLVVLAKGADRFGLIWSGGSSDLNTNLLLFAAGEGVSEHVNPEVDVLIVGIEGKGTVTIDGESQGLAQGEALIVPRGAVRSITSTSARFAYLTCHKRRGGIRPQVANTETTLN